MIVRFFALAALPLIFAPFLAEQRELPRHVWVQLFSFGALAAAIAAGKLRLSGRIAAALGAFASWLLIATAAAESPLRSLYGPYEGHTGALAYLAYLALILVPPKRESLPHFAALLVASGVVQAIVGVYQRSTGAPMVGTIGHVAFFAPFLALGTVAALGWASIARRRAVWVAALAAAAFQASLLVMSGRRGALLGLIAGVLVMVALLQTAMRRRMIGGAAVLAVVIALSAMRRSGPDYEPRAVDRWSGLLGEAPVPKNIDTVSQREDFYRVAVEAAVERPLLGWGFGAFRDLYARFKSGDISRFETREHNVFLELAVAAGWPAAILFLIVIAALGRAAIARVLEEKEEPRAMTATALAIVTAYGVHLCFSFDQPALGAWAFTFAGFLAPSGAWGELSRRGKAIALAPVALAIAAAAVRPLADYHMARGLELERAGQVAEAIAAYESGVRAAPHECLFALKLAAILNGSPAEGARQRRIELMTACAIREPRNAFVHYHLGLALAPVSDPATTLLQRSEAIHHLALATKLAPAAGVFHQGLAQALATFGDPQAALNAIDRALALEPDNRGYLHDRENILALLGIKPFR